MKTAHAQMIDPYQMVLWHSLNHQRLTSWSPSHTLHAAPICHGIVPPFAPSDSIISSDRSTPNVVKVHRCVVAQDFLHWMSAPVKFLKNLLIMTLKAPNRNRWTLPIPQLFVPATHQYEISLVIPTHPGCIALCMEYSQFSMDNPQLYIWVLSTKMYVSVYTYVYIYIHIYMHK